MDMYKQTYQNSPGFPLVSPPTPTPPPPPPMYALVTVPQFIVTSPRAFVLSRTHNFPYKLGSLMASGRFSLSF